MSIDLADVEKVLRKRAAKKYYKLRNAYRIEDALQEGLIRAWRDLENGYEDFHHVVNRADMQMRKHLYSEGLTTGAPKRDRDGIQFKRGKEKREKILAYVKEFREKNGRDPHITETADALGMTRTTTGYHFKFIRENQNEFLTQNDGKQDNLDRKTYRDSEMPLDYLTDENAVMTNRDLREYMKTSVNFETLLVGEYNLISLINLLDDEDERAVLYYTFVENLSQREIGQKIDVSQTQVTRLRKYALTKLKELISEDSR